MAVLWLVGVAELVSASSCGFIAAIKTVAVLWLYSGNKARSCVYTYAYILFVLMEESIKSYNTSFNSFLFLLLLAILLLKGINILCY